MISAARQAGGPSGRTRCPAHHDCLSPWAAERGARLFAVGSVRPTERSLAREASEARHAVDPSRARTRAAAAASVEAEPGRRESVCVYVIARRALGISHCEICDRRSRQGGRHQVPCPSAYAAARLWLLPGERRPGYQSDSTLPRAQEHYSHGEIHRFGERTIRRFLERLRQIWTAEDGHVLIKFDFSG
jgi:hypothetical protein